MRVRILELCPRRPKVATYTDAASLRLALLGQPRPPCGSWIHVEPCAAGMEQTSALSLLDALLLIQESSDLPPLSVKDAIEVGCRWRQRRLWWARGLGLGGLSGWRLLSMLIRTHGTLLNSAVGSVPLCPPTRRRPLRALLSLHGPSGTVL